MDESIERYYAEMGELDRLIATPWGRLEYLRTRELVERVLPSTPCDVLDVGGATGVHASWLAEQGHHVHLVDPSPEHVRRAAALPGVTAAIGDARALDVVDDSADVALLLGPLYHLLDRVDRVRALTEARRVTRRGGVVVAAAIGRFASILDMAAFGRLADPAVLRSVRETLRTGVHDPDLLGFTTAYFHTAAQLRAEFVEAGLDDVSVFGLEGAACILLKRAESAQSLTDAVVESVLALARETEQEPALLDTNSHLLAVARVSTGERHI